MIPKWGQIGTQSGSRTGPKEFFAAKSVEYASETAFGTVWGRFWADFGAILGGFWYDFGSIWTNFG